MRKVFSFLGAVLAAGLLFASQVYAVDPEPDLTLSGNDSGANFGTSAAVVDLNCDEIDDLVIGAPNYYNESTYSYVGKIFVHYGSTAGGLTSEPSWSLDGDSLGEEEPVMTRNMYFGLNVVSAGDLNGDGCDDLAVAAPLWGAIGGNKGKVWVFHSNPDIEEASAWDWRVHSNETLSRLGWTMAHGKVNDDVYDDLLISSNKNGGRIFVYFGSATGLTDDEHQYSYLTQLPDQEITADPSFGNSITWIDTGNFNGDVYEDLIVGNHLYSSGGYYSNGKVWIFHGSSDGIQSTPAWTNTIGDQSNTGYGIHVASGDVDGDGFDEAIVGAYLLDLDGFNNAGAAFVYDLPSADPATTLNNDRAFANFGFWVSAGDFDNDGYADVIVSDPVYAGSTENDNQVKIYAGSEGGTLVTPGWQDEKPYGTYFGSSLAVGDFDKNGDLDLSVGAKGVNSGKGAAYIYYNVVLE